MKKRLPVILVIVAIIAIALIYIFTRHTHTFAEATCTTAKICECGEIEGEPLGHTWVDATTENPKTCSFCGLTEGEALKSDPSIPTFNAKQGTVDVVSNKEPEIPLGTAPSEALSETPSEAEKSNEDTVNLEILEDQQFRNETAQKMVEQAKEYYEQGLITKEEYDGIIEGAKTLEEGIQWDLPEDLTTPHINVDVPGTTPSDPSSYGDYHLGEGGELPDHLKGNPFD